VRSKTSPRRTVPRSVPLLSEIHGDPCCTDLYFFSHLSRHVESPSYDHAFFDDLKPFIALFLRRIWFRSTRPLTYPPLICHTKYIPRHLFPPLPISVSFFLIVDVFLIVSSLEFKFPERVDWRKSAAAFPCSPSIFSLSNRVRCLALPSPPSFALVVAFQEEGNFLLLSVDFSSCLQDSLEEG